MFEPHKPNYYTVKLFQEIEGFDKDKFGNTWYNVLFEGDAETFMWLKKDPPVEGQKYYGHIEPTASGKRLRFKTDKPPETATASGNSEKVANKYLRDVTDMPVRFMLSVLQYYDVQHLETNPTMYRNYVNTVKLLTEEALSMIDNIRSGAGASDRPSEPSPAIPQEPTLKDPRGAAATSLKEAWDRTTHSKSQELSDDELASLQESV